MLSKTFIYMQILFINTQGGRVLLDAFPEAQLIYFIHKASTEPQIGTQREKYLLSANLPILTEWLDIRYIINYILSQSPQNYDCLGWNSVRQSFTNFASLYHNCLFLWITYKQLFSKLHEKKFWPIKNDIQNIILVLFNQCFGIYSIAYHFIVPIEWKWEWTCLHSFSSISAIPTLHRTKFFASNLHS